MEKNLENYGECLKEIAVNALTDYWDGSKFFGSLPPVSEWTFVDYWTLRKRSMKLFKTNLYAKGILRRLIDNEINTGITATPTPVGQLIWSEINENDALNMAVEFGSRISTEFNLYCNSPVIFDWGKKDTFGAFQERVRLESLLSGDGIIISRIDKETGLPRWQWVNGDNIRTPDSYVINSDNYILHGVEFNKYGKKVAFHIRSYVNGQFYYERIPVRGERSGRLISWMVYGSETLLDEVRGEPFLADAIYMLKDLDRARDAEVRASLVNAMIPLFFKKDKNAIGLGPRPSDMMRAGAIPANPQNNPGIIPANYPPALPLEIQPPTRKIDIMNPGTTVDLAENEDVVSFNTQRPNVNFSSFERAVISVLAWSKGIPPEVLIMEFGNNYSASRQANNEYEVALKHFVKRFSEKVLQPMYECWLTQNVLTGQLDLPRFMKAYGIAESWRTIQAWFGCVWMGLSRPAVNRLAEVNASEKALDNMLTTYDIEARRHSGLSLAQVVQAQKREMELMEKAGLVPHTRENNNGEPAYNKNGSSVSS